MIKIIKRGTPAMEKKYKCTCRECGSILEFLRGDALAGGDRNESWFLIQCPVCKFEIYMSELKETPEIGKGSYDKL